MQLGGSMRAGQAHVTPRGWRYAPTSRRAVQLPCHVGKHLCTDDISVIFLVCLRSKLQLAKHLCRQPLLDGGGSGGAGSSGTTAMAAPRAVGAGVPRWLCDRLQTARLCVLIVIGLLAALCSLLS